MPPIVTRVSAFCRNASATINSNFLTCGKEHPSDMLQHTCIGKLAKSSGSLSCPKTSSSGVSDLIAAELHAGEIVSLNEQLNTIRNTGWVPFMYRCWQQSQKETLLWSLQLRIGTLEISTIMQLEQRGPAASTLSNTTGAAALPSIPVEGKHCSYRRKIKCTSLLKTQP